MKRLVLFNNMADHNRKEGFYFLKVGNKSNPTLAGAMDFGCQDGGIARCNGRVAAGNIAHDNGRAGVYLKHSYLNNLTRIYLTNDNLQIVGNSSNNAVDRVTITGGGKVKFETKTEKPPGGQICQDFIPHANTLKNICVTSASDHSFDFEGVDTEKVGPNLPNIIGAIDSGTASKSASPTTNAVRGRDCPQLAAPDECGDGAPGCAYMGSLSSKKSGNTITAFVSGTHQGIDNDLNSDLMLTTGATSPFCYTP